MAFPYEIHDVEDNVQEELFSDSPEKLIEIGPSKFKLFKMYENFAEQYYNFELRQDDVFVCGFPRSGTTMTEELVWLLCNNCDIETGKRLEQFEKAYFFDIDSTITKDPESKVKQEKAGMQRKLPRFEDFNTMPKNRTRVFKTHLLPSLMPADFFTKGCKIVYVARNPKDVMVSNFHYFQRRQGNRLKSDFDTFANYFIKDKLRYTPYWSSISEFWQERKSSNLHFLFYEDYIKDLRGTIAKIATFLNVNLTTTQLDLLEEKFQFDNFKAYFRGGHILEARGDGNDGHVRKGRFGESQQYFEGDLRRKVDAWVQENVKEIGVEFSYLD